MSQKRRFFTGSLMTAIGLATLGAQAFGATNGLTLAVRSASGRDLTLNFTQDVVTSAVKSAVVCTEPSADLSQAKLWMPDMGHGSSPTTLSRQDELCTRVDRLNFLMPGVWELRVTLVDGDSGVFTFDVVD